MDPVRSMLFTPGNRLDMLGKAVQSGTDAVIVDLEDSVSLDNKPEARANLARLPESSRSLLRAHQCRRDRAALGRRRGGRNCCPRSA